MRRLRLVLALAGILLLVSAWVLRIGYLSYVVYVGALVAFVAHLMSSYNLEGLSTERHCTLRQGHIGDEAVVTVAVRNTRALFLPWLVLEDYLSPGLEVVEGVLARVAVMKPHGSVGLRYRVRCARRGYHRVGPVLLESGDLFGLTRRFRSSGEAAFITVYPKILPIDRYSIPTHRPLGETTAQMQIHEDPTRIAGVREYRHGDPLRRIHWKASAKTGQLHSKIYDPSCLLGANLILDFHAASWAGDRQVERSEFAVSVAASLASHLASRGVEVGLVCNGVDAADVQEIEPFTIEAANREEARERLEARKETDRLRPIEVPIRRGGESLGLILDCLARVELSAGLPLAEMVAREYNGWPREHTVVLIVPQLGMELPREIVRLKTTGFSVLVLLIDNPVQAPRAQVTLAGLNVPMLHLQRDSDLHKIVL